MEKKNPFVVTEEEKKDLHEAVEIIKKYMEPWVDHQIIQKWNDEEQKN